MQWFFVEFCSLYILVFCMFRPVHEFDVRLVINATLNKWPVESDRAVIVVFLTGSVCLPSTFISSVKGICARCEGQLPSLE